MTSHFLNTVDFNKQFLDVDFESLGPVAPSNPTYQQYKRVYLEETTRNMDAFNACLKQLEQLVSFQKVTEKKFVYTYIDENMRKDVIRRGKDIMQRQNRMYNNFVDYIAKTTVEPKQTLLSKFKNMLK
jgi:hypothetical protein